MAGHAGDGKLAERILRIVKRNLDWFCSYWWKKEVDHPAWCAVTNQNLCVAWAMSRYGGISGDMSYFERYGRPAVFWIGEFLWSMLTHRNHADFAASFELAGLALLAGPQSAGPEAPAYPLVRGKPTASAVGG